jgi:hypothetical protein
MNPELRADVSGFLGATFPDLPRSRPVLAVPTPRSHHMHIKYMFSLQRYGLMPSLVGRVLHRECGFDNHRWLGGSLRNARGGKARGRSDRRGRCRIAIALWSSCTGLSIPELRRST